MSAQQAQHSAVIQAGGKYVEVGGSGLHVLPSTLQATRSMWVVGTYAPGPVQDPRRFGWPRMVADFDPMVHQVQTTDFGTVYGRAFILNRPGTGKTASALWGSEFLQNEGLVDLTVIICPKSCMKDVWVPELMNIAPLKNRAVAHGTKLKQAFDGNRSYIILNHDGMRNAFILKTLAQWQKTKRILFIVDEATAFKSWTATRTKNLAKCSDNPQTRVWMMTGTPHAKDPRDIYGMCRIVNRNSVPSSPAKWRDEVMIQISNFKWVPRSAEVIGPKIARAMHPAICFDSKDCIELPARYNYGFSDDPVPGSDFASRGLHLTPQQVDLIGQLKKEAFAEFANSGKTLTVAHAGALRQKLFQIAQGVVITDGSGGVEYIDCQPRINDLLMALSRRKKKFLIFCHYKAVQYRVQQELARYGITSEVVNGDVTSERKRKAIFDRYRTDPTMHGIVAHPLTMAHGLTLTEGDTTFWYGPPSSPEFFDQGNHRQYRKGQKDPVHIWAQAASPEEASYFDVIWEGGSLEAATLEMFKP